MAWTFIVEFPGVAPAAALKTSVTGLERPEGRLTELGWNVAVTPFGSEAADSANVPETLPIATSFNGMFSLIDGAIINGCGLLIVSLPDEEPVAVVVPLTVGELDAVVEILTEVVEDDATIGIATKNAAEIITTTTSKPTSALRPGRCFSKQADPHLREFISFQNRGETYCDFLFRMGPR